MPDKKNEDEHELRALEGGLLGEHSSSKDPFISNLGPQLRSPALGSAAAAAASAISVSKIERSPGLSILSYCISSISMTVVNKYVVSGSDWNLNFFYLAVQAIVCIFTFILCRQLGLIRNVQPFDRAKARRWFPISFLLVGMIYTSTKALQFLSVPVYTIFKNLTIIVIAYGEVLWFGGSVTSLALLSFGLMVISSIVAAWADIQSAVNGDVGTGVPGETTAAISALNAGYAWMGMNVICTALYVLGTRKIMQRMNFKEWDTMYYNNLLSIPVLAVCTLMVEDWSAANLRLNFPPETRTNLVIGMVYSGLTSIFISYCSAWCIRVTSSTTYSMVGALNKLPLSICGLIFFSAPVTAGSVSAISIGVVSGIVYALAKIKQGRGGGGKPGMALPLAAVSASSRSGRDAANRS